MKKFICGLLVGLMLATSAVALAEGQALRLIINGEDITAQAEPIIINGRTLVPARALAEKLGATVEWDAKNNAVTISSKKQAEVSPTAATSLDTTSSKFTKAEAKSIPYKELARFPDNYIASKVVYTGEVIQVIEDGDNIILRVNVTKNEYGYYHDTIWVQFNKNIINGRILDDDILTFWGYSMGLSSYKTILGAEETIPRVIAYIVEINY